jgi:hypothetical protein
VVVFALTASVLFGVCGNLLTLNADEGIYLDGALRVMNGQSPYRDLFVHTGPGTYWLYGAIFRIFGATLSHARLVLICEIAAIITVVFFLTTRLTSYGFGLATTFIVFAFLTRDVGMIALNHRWDSSALAFIAVAPAFAALQSGSRKLSLLSGALAVAAAWCTPTLGVVALVIAAWMLVDRDARNLLPAFLLGMAAVSVVCVGILISERALMPMMDHLLWTRANYSGPNYVPYGWAGTGYGDIAAGLNVVGWVFFSLLLIVVALPAALPLATWAGWTLYFAIRRISPVREKLILFLLFCSIALLISTYPRWDVGHLLYVAPIAYVLAAVLIYRLLPAKAAPAVFIFLTSIVVLVWSPVILGAGAQRPMQTPGGKIRILPEDAKLLEVFYSRIRPGDSLFVFPYFATAYFFTRGINPTRFSYLQPAQMTDEDEATALKELQVNPPTWIVYSDVPPEVYLQHWPSSDPKRLRMHSLEQFFKQYYLPEEKHSHRLGEFVLLRRAPQ